MKSHDVMNLGFILAINARVEGMKAANAQREILGSPPLYDEQDFFASAGELERLARQAGEG